MPAARIPSRWDTVPTRIQVPRSSRRLLQPPERITRSPVSRSTVPLPGFHHRPSTSGPRTDPPLHHNTHHYEGSSLCLRISPTFSPTKTAPRSSNTVSSSPSSPPLRL